MIYLIKSYLPLGKYIYKVGFTDNMIRRYNHYFYANPGFEVVSTREGDEILQKLLHYYLYHKGFQYKRNGKLVSAIVFETRDIQYMFEPNHDFKGIWYKEKTQQYHIK